MAKTQRGTMKLYLLLFVFLTSCSDCRKPKNLLEEYIERIEPEEDESAKVCSTTDAKKIESENDEKEEYFDKPLLLQQRSEQTDSSNEPKSQQDNNNDINEEEATHVDDHGEKDSRKEDSFSHNFTRIMLPKIGNLRLNERLETILPGDVDVNITVLSSNPFVFGTWLIYNRCHAES